MSHFNADSPIGSLLQLDESSSGRIEPDEDGYERFIPTEDERLKIEDWLDRQITLAQMEAAPIRKQMMDNLLTYEAKGENNVLTLPFARRDVQQIVAWTANGILDAKPLVTIRPWVKGEFPVLVKGDPAMGTSDTERMVDAEDLAAAWEVGADYKLIEKQRFPEILDSLLTDVFRGTAPAQLKVCHEKTTRTVRVPTVEKTLFGVRIVAKEEVEVSAEEPTRILHVSGFNTLMRGHEVDIQKSRAFFEAIPLETDRLYELIGKDKQYNMVTKERLEGLIGGAVNVTTMSMSSIQGIDKRTVVEPVKQHDVFECWFRWPVKLAGGVIITMEFCGHFDKGSKTLLMLYRNPYDHGKRPYVDFAQRWKPFTRQAESTVEDVGTFQKVASQLVHLEIQSAVQAAVKAYKYRSGSTAGEWVEENKIKPGSLIPVDDMDDIQDFQTGSDFNSLIDIISFINNESSRTTAVSEVQRGLGIPSRTPAATISQVYESGSLQPKRAMKNICRGLSDVVKLYFLTEKQYSPYGESVPFRDPETRDLLMIPMRFPREAVFDQFSFEMTAAAEGYDKAAEFERLSLLSQVVDGKNEQLANIVSLIADPATPVGVSTLLRENVERSEELVRLMFEASQRTDGKRFRVRKETLDQIEQEKQALLQQQQMMQEQQQGGMGVEQGEEAADPEAGNVDQAGQFVG